MTSRLSAICFNAHEPLQLAQFWAGLLGAELVEDPRDGILVPPGNPGGYRLRFLPSEELKLGQNRAHFDLTSSSLHDQQTTVATALDLGGRHIDIGQLPEEEHVVLADPEGNEFCVIEPGNNFLAGCGRLGALACDGSQAVGYFWHKALNWPLVWDENEETAVQSPDGGTKITWGGPPVEPKLGRNRIHFDLEVTSGGDAMAEVDRLLSLGATRMAADDAPGRVALLDPDGNEFYVLTAD